MKAENRQYYKLGTDKKELPEFWCKHQNRSGDCSPFGLTMAGISSKAANTLENKYKYNGIEYNNDFDLNIGETFFRSHDPQIGRWLQVDPKTEKMEMWCPYVSNYNNPITFNDFLGDEPQNYPIIKITKEIVGTADQRIIGSYSGSDVTTKVNLYKVEVTDTEDASFKMSFMITRDAYTVLPGDDKGTSLTLSNTAFEPKDGNVNHYTAKVIDGGYPKGEGLKAFKLTQKGSEVMHAAPNENAVKAGSRTKSDVASGIMMHVGGHYKHKDGTTTVAASEGCFGVVNNNNSATNPSNTVSNSMLGKIITQANKSTTNKGKIEVVIEKRTTIPDKISVTKPN
jgi:RHS repeat-associated protein